jgi:hypothetical protein
MARSPVVPVGFDTPAKSEHEALRDELSAIGQTGLGMTFDSGPHIAPDSLRST